jgi:ribosomal protein S27AE
MGQPQRWSKERSELQRTMIQRQCPECGGELVLARRPDNQQGPGIVAGPSTYWRCGICGRGFTAEQVRDKRARFTSNGGA